MITRETKHGAFTGAIMAVLWVAAYFTEFAPLPETRARFIAQGLPLWGPALLAVTAIITLQVNRTLSRQAAVAAGVSAVVVGVPAIALTTSWMPALDGPVRVAVMLVAGVAGAVLLKRETTAMHDWVKVKGSGADSA